MESVANSIMKRASIFFVLIFLGLSTKQALASTYFVSTNGADTNSGTQSAPFKTFAKAVSLLRAGDILKIIGGTYNERLTLSTSGNSSGHIQIIPSSTSDHVVIDATSPDQSKPVVDITGNYIDISGLEVLHGYTCVSLKGQYSSASNMKVHDCVGNGLYTDGQHNVFDGNTVYLTNIENQPRTMSSGWGSAIKLRVGADDITVKNNTVYQNWGEGIAATRASNSLIENNRVYDNYSVGIYVDNSFNIKVNRNFTYCTGDTVFYKSGSPMAAIAIGEEYYDLWGAQLANITVTNNITALCGRGIIYYGSSVNGGLDGALIAFNTLWGSQKSSISIAYDPVKTRNIEVANNIFQQSGNLSWVEDNSVVNMHNNFWSPGMPSDPGSKGANDLSGDPKISGNPSAYDPLAFRLTATSPAIDKGARISSVTTDYENKTRGTLPDIGAFEYGGNPAPSPSASPLPTATPGPINFDLNNDGRVDVLDLKALLQKLLRLPLTVGDFNGDGKANTFDYASEYFKILFSTTPTPRPTPSTSPAPSGLTTLSARPYVGINDFHNHLIPSNAQYTREDRIGSFRHTFSDWTTPVYRIPPTENPPLVTIVNTYSGRTEYWPIPTYAIPTLTSDQKMFVMFKDRNVTYEFWQANWISSSYIEAGGMKNFPLDGTCVSNPTYQTVTAAGWSTSCGEILIEDFTDAQTGALNPNMHIRHAIAVSIPHELLKKDAFIPPAVNGEPATDNTGDIPLGTVYALPKSLNIEALNVHPFTRAVLYAARDYGLYVQDRNAAAVYNNKYPLVFTLEIGVGDKVFGIPNDTLLDIVQQETDMVVQQTGLYRVSGMDYSYVNPSPKPSGWP
jgi:parallel beta-helix repeat protein